MPSGDGVEPGLAVVSEEVEPMSEPLWHQGELSLATNTYILETGWVPTNNYHPALQNSEEEAKQEGERT